MFYLVEYDLVKVRDYEDLFAAIKKYPAYVKYLKSAWMIKTSNTASEVREYLKKFIDHDDKLLVMQIDSDPDWASYNLPSSVTDWFKQNL